MPDHHANLRRELHEANRRSWNAATRAHQSHKARQAEWLRGGGSTLFPEELELLGELRGRTLLHPQCNAGPDTLSLAAAGARVTGVDISDEAIAAAGELARTTGLPGEFVRADVYDFFEEAAAAGRRWEVVFASYGALGWLSELGQWARGVAGVLAPGGRLVVVEFHPVAYLFDESFTLRHPYFCEGQPDSAAGVGDYVAASGSGLVPWGFEEGVRDFVNPHPAHFINWTIAEILTAIMGAGLTIDRFHEWPYANGCKLYDRMDELPGRRWTLPAGTPRVPLMYGLRAVFAPR